jgi:hypothetical protein
VRASSGPNFSIHSCSIALDVASPRAIHGGRQPSGKRTVSEVAAYAGGAHGRGVRLAAIVACAQVRPWALYLNLETRDEAFAAAVFRKDVEELAIIVYAIGDEVIPRELGGPFRLVIPGYHDECRDLSDVARLEFSRDAGRDTRAPPVSLIPFGPFAFPADLVAPTARAAEFVTPRPD